MIKHVLFSERGWSRSLSPHPLKSFSRNSADNKNNENLPKPSQTKPNLPKPSIATELAPTPLMPLSLEGALVTSLSSVQQTQNVEHLSNEDENHPPPLPPRLPRTIQRTDGSLLGVENTASDNKEDSLSTQRYPFQQNGQHAPPALQRSISFSQITSSPRIEKRRNEIPQEVKIGDLKHPFPPPIPLNKGDLKHIPISLQPATSGNPSPIPFSPTSWRNQDIGSKSSSMDQIQFSIEPTLANDDHSPLISCSMELPPPGLFSSPRASESRGKKGNFKKKSDSGVETRESESESQSKKGKFKKQSNSGVETRDTDGVETRDTDTQTEDEDGILHRAR